MSLYLFGHLSCNKLGLVIGFVIQVVVQFLNLSRAESNQLTDGVISGRFGRIGQINQI